MEECNAVEGISNSFNNTRKYSHVSHLFTKMMTVLLVRLGPSVTGFDFGLDLYLDLDLESDVSTVAKSARIPTSGDVNNQIKLAS